MIRRPLVSLGVVFFLNALLCERAQSQLAPCAPPSGDRVIADNCTLTVTGGTYNTGSSAFASVLTAQNNGVLNVTGPVNLLSSGQDSTGGYAQFGGQLTFSAPGSSIATTGDSSKGLHAFNAGARIEATGLTIATGGFQSVAVLADYGGTVVVRSSSLATTGEQAPAIGAYGGTITISDSTIRTLGPSSPGLYSSQSKSAVTATNVTIDTFGANSPGFITQSGALLTTINVTARTTGEGSYGMFATTGGSLIGNGDTIATSGRGAHGLYADASPISASGIVISTSGESAYGALADAIGITIENSSLTTSGTGSDGVVLLKDASATLNGDTVTVNAAGAAALRIDTTAASPVKVVMSGGAWSAPTGSVLSVTHGTADIGLGSTSLSGSNWLAVVRSGSSGDPATARVVAASTQISGAAALGAGDTADMILRQGSTWTITGNSRLTSLINDGSTVRFATPGSSYRTLTVSNYTGVNGTIGVNAFIGGDGSPADLLVIDGGRALGRTMLTITNTGGLGAPTVGDGILVIRTDNGGATAPNAFVLASEVIAGPYDYDLVRGGVGRSTSDNWYLRTATVIIPDVDPVPPPIPTPDGPQPQRYPRYRKGVSLVTAAPAMALLYERTLLSGFHDRTGWDVSGIGDKLGWARAVGGRGRHGGERAGIYKGDPAYSYDIYAFQAGIDLYGRDTADGARDRVGAYVAAGAVSGDVKHFDGRFAGRNTIDAYSVGAYWTHIGASGWYVDAVVQGTWFELTAQQDILPSFKRDGFGWAASLEGGYPLDLGNGWAVEPQIQAIYQRANDSSGNDGVGLIRFSNVEALSGRIGLNLKKTWLTDEKTGRSRLGTWVTVNVWRNFFGSPVTSFSSASGAIPFHARLDGSWLEISGGIEGRLTAMTSVFAKAGYQIALDERQRGYEGRLGLKIAW